MSKKVRQANVISATQISPHIQRIVVGSDEFYDFPKDQQGAYVKVLLADPSKESKPIDLQTAKMRSYTIRAIDQYNGAITLDFVINQHCGIATNWAKQAKPGDKLAIAGPGPRKLEDFTQTDYLLIGDLTSVNAINGYLQKLPQSKNVNVIIHVPDKGDIIELDTINENNNHEVSWLISKQPNCDLINAVITHLSQANKKPLLFMALEASLIREINRIARDQFTIKRENIVCSAYWKHGIDADGLNVEKQQQSA